MPHYDAQALVLQGLVSFLAALCASLRVAAAMYFALKVRRILRRLERPDESPHPLPADSVSGQPRSVPEPGRQRMTLRPKVPELLRRAGGETSR